MHDRVSLASWPRLIFALSYIKVKDEGRKETWQSIFVTIAKKISYPTRLPETLKPFFCCFESAQ